MAEAPLVLILAGLAAYTVLGGADFGAGFWELLARGPRGASIREHTHRAMAPVWEANHVWLIFVLVVCWTAYPVAFSSIASTLTIPLFLAGIGIVLRGASYALRAGRPSERQEGVLSVVFALSSVLTPFALGATVGGIASARVPVGNAAGEEWSSWLNRTSVLIGVLAVASAAYLAAVYLAADAARADRAELVRAFRARALAAGLVAGAVAIAGLVVLRSDARPLFDGLTSGGGLAMVVVSIVAGAVTLALVWRSRFEPARVSAAVAVVAIIAGWGLGQKPSFLPGLSIDEAAAGDATLVAVLVSVAVGALVLVPSLAWLFRLTLAGRLEAEPSSGEADRSVGATLRVPPVVPAAAVAAVGGLVTFVAEGWLRGAGVAGMLIGGVACFLALAGEDGWTAG
jgi:cytochrome bd ubiquinol oxidase subunit II